MLAERMGRGLAELDPGRERVLVHGVSVGEVKGARALVEGLLELSPTTEIAISTTTDTGQRVARATYGEHPIVRFPIDVELAVNRFLDRVRPTAVVLIELEVWPNFLRACNRRGIPVVVVNGRITHRSHERYKLFRRLVPQFRRISYFAVQSEEYAERFRDLGVEDDRVFVTGNVKFDALRSGVRRAPLELEQRVGARAGQPVVVCGSTHEPEERYCVEAWRDHASSARLVIVARHPERNDELVGLFRGLGIEVERLSALRAEDVGGDPAKPLLVDTIGELEDVYALSDLVFVGGTLIPHGGQNLLEPAAQAKPVVRGPSVSNFLQEALLLDSERAAVEVASAEQLGPAWRRLLADSDERRAMGERGQRAVERQRGATERTLKAVAPLVLESHRKTATRGPRPA